MWAITVLSATLICMVSGFKGIYPTLPTDIKGSGLCKNQSEVLGQSLHNNTLWAYKMWESSAKDPIGVIRGSTYQLGDFDECINTEFPIKAQYCLVHLKIVHKKNYTIADPYSLNHDPYESVYERIQYTGDPNKVRRDIIHIGICVPSACTSNDITNTIKNYIDQNRSNDNNYEVFIDNIDCQTKEKFTWDTKNISFCSLLIFLVLLVLACTYADLRIRNEENENSKAIKVLLCFSVKENIKDLIKSESNSALNILYGFKIFLMCGILLGHSVVVPLMGPIANFEYLEKINRNLTTMFICKGDTQVDVFFLFSGLLVTYSYFVQSEKKNVNPLRAIILRYFRLVPILAFMTFFYSTIYYYIGSGPIWKRIVGAEVKYCQKNWWTNLLLVNNYVDTENLCILQAWYIPCDFHLFIFSIPVNIILRKNRKIGLSLLGVLLGISILIPFLITYIGNKDPFYYMFNDFSLTLRHDDAFQTVYIPTHTKAGPYILGMFFGYIYYKLRNRKFKISTVYSQILFSGSFVIAVGCLFLGVIFFNPYRPYNILEGALYAALHRPIYALAFGIIILVASYGYIPIIKNLLNIKITVPLGKLTFGAYMTHMFVQLAKTGSRRSPMHLSLFNSASNMISEVALAFVMGFFLFLLVENPFSKLAKEMLPTDEKHKEEQKNITITKNESREIICSTHI